MAKGKFELWRTREGLLLLEGWARDGLTGEQIADRCGCSRDTLADWKKRFPEISAALAKNAEAVDREVENALLRRAVGYDYTEARTDYTEKDGVREVVKVTETVKHMPPDVRAADFWLRNRKREQYRDRWSDAAGGQEDTGCILLPEAVPEDGPAVEEAEDG